MEFAVSIFVGLVLFMAFGKPAAEFVKNVSPTLAIILAKILKVAGVVGAITIWIFTKILVHDTKEDDHALLFAIVGLVAGGATWRIGMFVGRLMESVVEASQEKPRAGRGIFAEPSPTPKSSPPATSQEEDVEEVEDNHPPKPRKKKEIEGKVYDVNPARFKLSDGDCLWEVDLEEMTAMFSQSNGSTKSYLLRRTKDGHWMAKMSKASLEKNDVESKEALELIEKEKKWFDLEDLDARLATVVDTKWRRFTSVN